MLWLDAILSFTGSIIGYGILIGAPILTFVTLVNLGVQIRTAIAAALIVFVALLGWGARGIYEDAKGNAALSRALRERDLFEQRVNELAAEVERRRDNIRGEVDDAISDIIRANQDADRGDSCDITDSELDGLRRAMGYGEGAGNASATTGKSYNPVQWKAPRSG